MTAPAQRRMRGDAGSVAVELPVGAALLLIPVAVLLMTVPQWPERVSVARAMAREAASLYATAPSESAGRAAAQQAVADAATNCGFNPDHVAMSVAGTWCRACTITVDVTIPVPALEIPLIGTVDGFDYTATATQRIDDYGSVG